MASKCVSNTGPILHLNEINLINVLDIFSFVFIPEEVAKELQRIRIVIPKKVKILKIKPELKDTIKVLTNEHNLDLGESEAITLILQEKIDYFLTDDLEARNLAKIYSIETHGTIGIILRAFREKLIDKKMAIEKVKELYTSSSLFITKDLVDKIRKAINEFSIV